MVTGKRRLEIFIQLKSQIKGSEQYMFVRPNAAVEQRLFAVAVKANVGPI